MSRVLRIDACQECPHCLQSREDDIHICEIKVQQLVNIQIIPDFCPLPDDESKVEELSNKIIELQRKLRGLKGVQIADDNYYNSRDKGLKSTLWQRVVGKKKNPG